jgi:hypothetical protein
MTAAVISMFEHAPLPNVLPAYSLLQIADSHFKHYETGTKLESLVPFAELYDGNDRIHDTRMPFCLVPGRTVVLSKRRYMIDRNGSLWPLLPLRTSCPSTTPQSEPIQTPPSVDRQKIHSAFTSTLDTNQDALQALRVIVQHYFVDASCQESSKTKNTTIDFRLWRQTVLSLRLVCRSLRDTVDCEIQRMQSSNSYNRRLGVFFAIKNVLEQDGPATVNHIRTKTSLTRRAVDKMINEMYHAGIVTEPRKHVRHKYCKHQLTINKKKNDGSSKKRSPRRKQHVSSVSTSG